uniref:Uncharacterized protein n=1 Tax=Sus scrofa TaxID=9823 RepID=A0A8D1WIH2_PIG
EILRIHMQLVTVQLTQLRKGALEVVHVLDRVSEGGQHLLPVGLDLGVSHDGGGRGHVAKAVKEPLGPRVDHQEPLLPAHSLASSLFHIHSAPQASDHSLLLSSKMHHGVRSRSLQVLTEASRKKIQLLTENQSVWLLEEWITTKESEMN